MTIVYIVCNCGVTDRQFLAAFSELDPASVYAHRKCGDYDDIVIYRHEIDSKELGDIVSHTKTITQRYWS